MADEPEKKKRRIRKSETVRQHAEKARAVAGKPEKPSLIGRILKKIFRPLRVLSRPLKWIGRHFIPRYFRNSFHELSQVTWPNRKQSRQLTAAVIVFAAVFAAVVTSLDYGLDKIFKKVFLHE